MKSLHEMLEEFKKRCEAYAPRPWSYDIPRLLAALEKCIEQRDMYIKLCGTWPNETHDDIIDSNNFNLEKILQGDGSGE